MKDIIIKINDFIFMFAFLIFAFAGAIGGSMSGVSGSIMGFIIGMLIGAMTSGFWFVLSGIYENTKKNHSISQNKII